MVRTCQAEGILSPTCMELAQLKHSRKTVPVGKTAAEMARDVSVNEGAANGQLIAAAPDLLAAVEHLIHYAEKLESAADLGKETGNITLDKYRELVAKAKGSPC